MILCVYGVNWEVTLASFLAYGGALEPYLRQVDVERHEMASVMGICGSLVGPKSGNVEKVSIFKAFLKGQRVYEDPGAGLQVSEPGYMWELGGATLVILVT